MTDVVVPVISSFVWPRTADAVQILEKHGCPVSPAPREMIRQFGELNTVDNRPPPPIEVPGVKLGPVLFKLNPFQAYSHEEELKEMEKFLGVDELSPIGDASRPPGIMCIDPLGRVFFEESTWGYSGERQWKSSSACSVGRNVFL